MLCDLIAIRVICCAIRVIQLDLHEVDTCLAQEEGFWLQEAQVGPRGPLQADLPCTRVTHTICM